MVDLRKRIELLASLPIDKLDRMSLQSELQRLSKA